MRKSKGSSPSYTKCKQQVPGLPTCSTSKLLYSSENMSGTRKKPKALWRPSPRIVRSAKLTLMILLPREERRKRRERLLHKKKVAAKALKRVRTEERRRLEEACRSPNGGNQWRGSAKAPMESQEDSVPEHSDKARFRNVEKKKKIPNKMRYWLAEGVGNHSLQIYDDKWLSWSQENTTTKTLLFILSIF